MEARSKSTLRKAELLCRLFILLAASLLLASCALPIPLGSTTF